MTQVLPGFHPLIPEHKAAIDAASPAAIARHLGMASALGDVETCTYITAKHFDRLPLKVQQELTRSGMKSISDITQDLVDGKYKTPEATVVAKAQLMLQTYKAFASVH